MRAPPGAEVPLISALQAADPNPESVRALQSIRKAAAELPPIDNTCEGWSLRDFCPRERMTEIDDLGYEPDEIGEWSERKISIVTKYAKAFVGALKDQPFKLHYIDGFTGGGVAIRKVTRDLVITTARRILDIEPPFAGYHLVDFDPDKAAAIKAACQRRPRAVAHCCDANLLLPPILRTIRFEEFKRALCFLDPYKVLLSWDVLKVAGSMGTIDAFINFPTHDIQRNVLRNDPAKIVAQQAADMTQTWGDESWRPVAYAAQRTLFGDWEKKQPIDALLSAYRERLISEAGFKHASEPLAMRNSRGAILYHLFFATQQPLALRIANDILKSESAARP
jgi:three-Cys-motif partner protein